MHLEWCWKLFTSKSSWCFSIWAVRSGEKLNIDSNPDDLNKFKELCLSLFMLFIWHGDALSFLVPSLLVSSTLFPSLLVSSFLQFLAFLILFPVLFTHSFYQLYLFLQTLNLLLVSPLLCSHTDRLQFEIRQLRAHLAQQDLDLAAEREAAMQIHHVWGKQGRSFQVVEGLTPGESDDEGGQRNPREPHATAGIVQKLFWWDHWYHMSWLLDKLIMYFESKVT